jgi:hypothetical protein
LIRGNKRVVLKSAEGRYVTGPILHPGTPGKRAWTRAVNEFRGEMRPLVEQIVKEAVGAGQ